MKAYVELIQMKEREIGCDVLTHQKVNMLHLYAVTLFLTTREVERCGLRRQPDQNRYGWSLFDSGYGKGRY